MASQSVRVHAVTRETPLTALRNASVPVGVGDAAFPRWTDLARGFSPELTFRIHTDLTTVESEWRRFERAAEATPFQTFEWLSAWQHHVGTLDGTLPAIAVGRYADGSTAFICPLAIEPQRSARRLRWLGQDLCDYNAPLLARDFSSRVTPDRFLVLWVELLKQMQSDPRLRHDWIEFEKMPQTVGAQINPFVYLGVTPNANSAHITRLGDDWEKF
jgi:CelD/BcsL family acetyltransferase involved in cellulose biosynthesis